MEQIIGFYPKGVKIYPKGIIIRKNGAKNGAKIRCENKVLIRCKNKVRCRIGQIWGGGWGGASKFHY